MNGRWQGSLATALLALVALVLAMHGPQHELGGAEGSPDCALCQVTVDEPGPVEPDVAPAHAAGRLADPLPAERLESAPAAPHGARGPPRAFA